MLIISRNIAEKIRIGDDIEIMVLEVTGQQVRLGIKAPKSIDVHREEVYQRIQLEKQGLKPKP